jgi:hypothetical protein
MKRAILINCVVAAAVVGLFPGVVAALPTEPFYGAAVADGQFGEWNLSGDFFANMYRAGRPDFPLESKLYLRYDCDSGTMFVLVLDEPGVVGLEHASSTTAWVAIDDHSNKVVNELSGNDGIPPDFAWVDPGFDGDPSHNRGFEASFPIAWGEYAIIVHTDVLDESVQTSATQEFPGSGPGLVIDCTESPVEASTWSTVKAIYK